MEGITSRRKGRGKGKEEERGWGWGEKGYPVDEKLLQTK